MTGTVVHFPELSSANRTFHLFFKTLGFDTALCDPRRISIVPPIPPLYESTLPPPPSSPAATRSQFDLRKGEGGGRGEEKDQGGSRRLQVYLRTLRTTATTTAIANALVSVN